jgi:hypothetical protein
VRIAQPLVLLTCLGGMAGCGDGPPEGPCEAEVAHIVGGDTQIGVTELQPRTTDEECAALCAQLAAQSAYLSEWVTDSTEEYSVTWCERTATLSREPAGLY